MDKQEIKSMVIQLMDDMRPEMERKLEQLLEQPEFKQDEKHGFGKWVIPKIIMCILLKRMAFQYEPPKTISGASKAYKEIDSVIF